MAVAIAEVKTAGDIETLRDVSVNLFLGIEGPEDPLEV